jgi:hypothetical protein
MDKGQDGNKGLGLGFPSPSPCQPINQIVFQLNH